MLNKKDKNLIKKAQSLVGAKIIKGGIVKEVGCALITEKGKIFTGVCLDLYCGIGFCAEHTAVSQMVTQTNETHIKTIVAVDEKGVMPPCGRCRELLNLLDVKNINTGIVISANKKVKLRNLLPSPWSPNEAKKNCLKLK
jgi:cytidine deaminase